MKAITEKMVENFKQEFPKFFMQQVISIDIVEAKLIEKVQEDICSMIVLAYESRGKMLRKVNTPSTERRGDIRMILSRFDEISYRHTYY